jgi:hypothetical protein
MTSKLYRRTFVVAVLGALLSVSTLDAQPSPAGNVRDAVAHAKEAVNHGK